MKRTNKKVYLENVVEVADEYKWSELNCFYRAFANVFNSMDEDYYDVFLMLIMTYVVYVINGERVLTFDRDDYVLQYYKKELQQLFDVELRDTVFGNKKKMVMTMQEELSKKNVIVVPCDLYYLPYSKTYLELHKRHYLIVKGVDVSKNIVYVLDNMHNRLGADVNYSDFMIDADVVYNMNSSFIQIFDMGKRDKYFWIVGADEKKGFDKRVREYIKKVSDFILEKDIKQDYEYKIFNAGKEVNIVHYMEYMNTKKLLFDSMKKYIDRLEDGSEVTKLRYKMEYYLRNKEESKIYYAARLHKSIEEKELVYLQEILNEEKEIWQEFGKIIEVTPLKKAAYESVYGEYKIINNKKATIGYIDDGFYIQLDDNGTYDIWKNVNDGVIVYKENKVSQLDFAVEMTVSCKSGDSNHTGIFLKLEDGTKLLFGSMGRLNMAVYKLDDTNNYDCLTKSMPFDREVELRARLEQGVLSYYVNDECILSNKTKYGVCQYGVFAKTWQVNRCDVQMRIMQESYLFKSENK